MILRENYLLTNTAEIMTRTVSWLMSNLRESIKTDQPILVNSKVMLRFLG